MSITADDISIYCSCDSDVRGYCSCEHIEISSESEIVEDVVNTFN